MIPIVTIEWSIWPWRHWRVYVTDASRRQWVATAKTPAIAEAIMNYMNAEIAKAML